MTVLSRNERLERDLLHGLAQVPPRIPPRWFYDERGSQLFDEITTLPEYYPTRRETQILTDRAATIAALTGADTLVELGSGTSTKTRLLLDALVRDQVAVHLVPLDVSEEVLLDSARALAADYPSVMVTPVVADFEDPLPDLPGRPGHRLLAFLGGTIGNLELPQRQAFYARLRAALSPGDHVLLGADLVKDPRRLVAAYDDSAGVTAAFNRNLVDVLRRELDLTGLEPDDVEHVARWNSRESRIEMWLRTRRTLTGELNGRPWSVPRGFEVLTEISVKFRLDALREELAVAGLQPVRSWTDAAGDFSLTLARR